jgi:hypothetical protein
MPFPWDPFLLLVLPLFAQILLADVLHGLIDADLLALVVPDPLLQDLGLDL